MHVIPAEILNEHNKILIDNITSELIVIENAVEQNDIDDNETMEDLQESLLNLSVEMIDSCKSSISSLSSISFLLTGLKESPVNLPFPHYHRYHFY
jgi:hypothetical protein